MNTESAQRRILFLCTGNSCRSQMAEGFLRHLAGEQTESLSAGSKPAGYVHPLAVQVMRESGIDISMLVSKSLEEFLPPRGELPDLVITVCDAAAQSCPLFPADVKIERMPFDDPAHAEGTDEEKLVVFRRVRDEIRTAIEEALESGRWMTGN